MERAEETAVLKKARALKQRCAKYGITPAIYNAIGDAQNWRCGICGRPQSDFNVSLNIDHKHFKVVATRVYADNGVRGWFASAIFNCEILAHATEKTKIAAIREVRRLAMPKSIRGLLCPGRHGKPGHGCCNRLLGRVDERWWLQAADRYLADPPARKGNYIYR